MSIARIRDERPSHNPYQERRLPVGAEVRPDGVHFRVWASSRRRVEVVLEGPGLPTDFRSPVASYSLEPEGTGYFSALVKDLRPGALYRYRLDGEDRLYPDPASRYQPRGPHGPSLVVDPDSFVWSDAAWNGVRLEGQVIYELHVGTFTREGTWAAAARQLPELAALGITVIEMMPVAEFPGRFGWGYDGVGLYAPSHLYGEPDDLRRFVDAAHRQGLAVILDVVYNHLGPDGNYLGQFSTDYFTHRYANEWGEPLNFDGPNSRPVREFFVTNAGYWVDEFHMDGLRLDATQQTFDSSPVHVLADITRRAREAGGKRSVLVVGENEPQHVGLVRPISQGGCGLDALWDDDFHHSTAVAMRGHNEAYYSEYLGTPQELVSAMKYGYLYQGQRYYWQGRRRGAPTFGLGPATFITFLQNHDQVANTADGRRCHQLASPGVYRALTALLLLAPQTPMMFQGQEFAASAPFLYFADHKPDLAALVRMGRTRFLSQFPSIATETISARLSDPSDPSVFEACKLDWSERESHSRIYKMHRDLLRLRRGDPAFSAQRPGGVDGAVLGPQAFVLRFFGEGSGDRLLLVNLGTDLTLRPAPEPLLAPPPGMNWEVMWSSEHPDYGGTGTPDVDTEAGWRILGHAAIVLRPVQGAELVSPMTSPTPLALRPSSECEES